MRPVAFALVVALAWGSADAPAHARAFTVEDLLAQESLGASVLDPSGRWLVFEQRDAYVTADRFDTNQATSYTLGRLRIVDTTVSATARPLLADDPRGLLIGAFSPSGARLAVYQIQGRTWRLGIVGLANGAVRWLPVSPQESSRGRSLQWLNDHELLVLDRPDRRAPSVFRQGSIFAERLPPRWEAAATGAGSNTAYGSGAYLGVRRRAPPNRLLRIDAVTGATSKLAEGAFVDLEVSPEGRRVALLETGHDLQPRADGPVRGAAGSETEASVLSLLDLQTHTRAHPCAGCDIAPTLLSWSPDGTRLLVFSRGGDGLWPSGTLVAIDAGTNQARAVAAGLRPRVDLNPATVWTGWLGDEPLVFGREPGGVRDDWYRVADDGLHNMTAALADPSKGVRTGGSSSFNVLARDGLWQIGRDGRSKLLVDHAAPLSIADNRFGIGARLARAAPTRLWLARSLGQQARNYVGITADGQRLEVGASRDRSELVGVTSIGDLVERATEARGMDSLAITKPASTTEVVRVNRGWVALDVPEIVAVRHTGPAGQPLVSWLFLPKAAAPAALIVQPYLGSAYPQPPKDPTGRPDFFQNVRVLTGAGYAVLLPSLPNPPGGMTDPGEGLATRLLDIVQAAAATPGAADRIDVQRLALMGFSFGGYTVMEAITQTDCFRAAIEMDGVSDFTGYWSSLPAHLQLDGERAYWSNWHTGVVEETQPEFRAPPWKDPMRYVRNSPIYAADRINTPLLLIHGAQDGLPLAQSEGMYSALYRQGKDALLVVYWGAMHAPVAPGDVRDVYARTFDFLRDHLAGGIATRGSRDANPEPASASGGPTLPSPPPKGCPTASPPR